MQEKLKKRFLSQSKQETTHHSPLRLPVASLSCSALILLCSFSALLENVAWIFNSELRGDLLLPKEKDTGDRMRTQCHAWSGAFPGRLRKAHSQMSRISEQLYRFFKFKGEGNRKIHVSNTLPSPKSSLLLMFRSVNN